MQCMIPPTTQTISMSPPSQPPFRMRRVGVIMEPDPSDPYEVEGVLNPATARGPDGHLYLLARLVGAGNYSRIGVARVLFDAYGDPMGVERLGVALEPQAPYELNSRTGGGVEDPRITYLPMCGGYMMTYTAYTEAGPRIAAARSSDLLHWRRVGLVGFAPLQGVDLGAQHNKDAVLFPEAVVAPDGRLSLALLHRPTFQLADAASGGELALLPALRGKPSIWISYAPLEESVPGLPLLFGQHHVLASPHYGWEHLKIGAGTPPVRLPDGRWLVIYHGVSGRIIEGVDQQQQVRYCAGALVLDGDDPRKVVYRSAQSLMAPRAALECRGIVPNVVFPTGIDARTNGTLDVYYGMADSCIGVARAEPTDSARISGAAA